MNWRLGAPTTGTPLALLRSSAQEIACTLMEHYGLGEDEALVLISLGVDFGVSQAAHGNKGVHAIVRKQMFR
jgi:acetamidase/formamidase